MILKKRGRKADTADDSVFVRALLTGAGKQLLGDSYGKILKDWKNASVTLENTSGTAVGRKQMEYVIKEQISDLEIYAFLDPDVNPKRRECKPWSFYLTIQTKKRIYSLPVCKGIVYLLSPEPRARQHQMSSSRFKNLKEILDFQPDTSKLLLEWDLTLLPQWNISQQEKDLPAAEEFVLAIQIIFWILIISVAIIMLVHHVVGAF